MIVIERARDLEGNVIKIHSAGGLEFDLPSVLMRPQYVKWDKHLKYSRYNVYQRDDYTCQYCGSTEGMLTIDHVRPKSEINGDEGNLWLNRVTCCTICNGQKGNKSLEEMKGERCHNGRPFRLLKQPSLPSRPALSRFLRLIRRDNLEWLDYLPPGWERVAECLGRGWLVKEYLKRDETILGESEVKG